MSYGNCRRAVHTITCVNCGAKEDYDITELGSASAPEYKHRYLCRKCKEKRIATGNIFGKLSLRPQAGRERTVTDNSDKIILDLCGGTGAWSRLYKENGYDVRLITLPDYDVRTYEPPKNVYGILAAPPCTEFSVAKGARPRDLKCGMEIVQACLTIIWKCRLQQKLHFWAMENPRGLLRQFLGLPNFTFEQWQYGGNKRKATDIWGYCKKPAPTVKQIPESISVKYPNGRANARDWTKIPCPPEYANYISQFHGDAKRAALRAITPPGFAKAFFKANK